MRRRTLLLGFSLAIVGCGEAPEPTRVQLPAGLRPTGGLTPDPPRAQPPRHLTKPAVELEPAGGDQRAAALSLPAGSVIDNNSPSIDGVCSYDEKQVSCWNINGEPDPKAKAKVRVLLTGGLNALPMVVGSLNRLVLTTMPASIDEQTVQVVEDGKLVQTVRTAGFRTASPRQTLVHITADPKMPKVSLRFLQSTRIPKEVPIALRKGARASLEGTKFTIDSIEKWDGTLDGMRMPMTYSGWKIVVKVVGIGDPNLKLFPVDPTPFVLADGRHVSEKQMLSGKMPPKGVSGYRIQPVIYSTQPAGSLVVVIDQDPAKVKTISLGASREHVLELTGIPLNPK